MSDILAVNIGSSSLKFALYTVLDAEHVDRAHVSGLIEGLEPGGQPRLSMKNDGESTTQTIMPHGGEEPLAAGLRALETILEVVLAGRPLLAVAHRIVHGGTQFREAVLLDDQTVAQLSRLNPLAPLHQPHNLAGVRACMAHFKGVPQIGCFDTAFHTTTPPLESHFGLPLNFYDEGVRRYGFHGLSYDYVSSRLARRTDAAKGRLLMAHLGNGSSLCATVGGRSVATTMGFSALDGLMMGSRSGALDPGVLLYLMAEGWSPERIGRLLYRESGLLGVSGISADMRRLRGSDSPEARFAIDLYVYRIIREAGGLIAVMGGVDGIAFTGGIGEHDAKVRAAVVDALRYLGVEIAESLNAAADGSQTMAIQAPNSQVEVWVVPTDEGRVAAEQALVALREPNKSTQGRTSWSR